MDGHTYSWKEGMMKEYLPLCQLPHGLCRNWHETYCKRLEGYIINTNINSNRKCHLQKIVFKTVTVKVYVMYDQAMDQTQQISN